MGNSPQFGLLLRMQINYYDNLDFPENFERIVGIFFSKSVATWVTSANTNLNLIITGFINESFKLSADSIQN